MRIGLQEVTDISVPDPLTDHLRVDPGLEGDGGIGVPQIVKRDARQAGCDGESVEALADAVGVRGSAVFVGEDVIAGLVVAAKELSLLVLQITPLAQRGHRRAVDRDRLVGVDGLAAGLVDGTSGDDDAVVVHGDQRSVEVDVGPFEAADLSSPDTGGQFEQKQCHEPIGLDGFQEGLDLLGIPHGTPGARLLRRFDVGGRVVGDVLPREGVGQGAVNHGVDIADRLGRQARGLAFGHDACLVTTHRCAGGVDCGTAGDGDGPRCRRLPFGDASGPVRIHVSTVA